MKSKHNPINFIAAYLLFYWTIAQALIWYPFFFPNTLGWVLLKIFFSAASLAGTFGIIGAIEENYKQVVKDTKQHLANYYLKYIPHSFHYAFICSIILFPFILIPIMLIVELICLSFNFMLSITKQTKDVFSAVKSFTTEFSNSIKSFTKEP